MKIYMNQTPVAGPWGGGAKWVEAFQLLSRFEFVSSPGEAEVALCTGLDRVEEWINHPNLFYRANECDSRKGTTHVNNILRTLAKQAQQVISVSNWLKKEVGLPGVVIHNGCDKQIFKAGQKLNLVNGKVNIVCHHWSGHVSKGLPFYEHLAQFVEQHEGFTFTFIGRIKTKLSGNSRHIAPLWGAELGAELGKYDVCINASLNDPGPNSVLETISCGIPTYVHTSGGGGVEFAGQSHTFRTFEDVEQLLLGRAFVKNSYEPTSWETCIEQYMELLKQ